MNSYNMGWIGFFRPAFTLSLSLMVGFFSGCIDDAPDDPVETEILVETGSLQVSFNSPNDVAKIYLELYQGDDDTGDLLESRTLGPGESTALFEILPVGNYHIQAEALNPGDTVIEVGKWRPYGNGIIQVQSDTTGILYILLKYPDTLVAGPNHAPSINAIAINGPTQLAAKEDPMAEPTLHFPAPDENEPIEFSIQAWDRDADPLTVLWTVKDGPDYYSAADVGTITGPSFGPRITWMHDTEGKYWVTVVAMDSRGGVAASTFAVWVFRGAPVWEHSLEFNSLPTIEIKASVVPGSRADLSDTVISLMASAVDPDEQPIVSTIWTEDCHADIVTDEAYLFAWMIPVVAEACTVTMTACDSIGCNQSTITLDINRFTLCNGFGPYEPGQEPIDCQNWCFPDPALHECVVNDWECGDGHNACGWIESCGTCSAPGTTCIDHICSPDGGVDEGI